MGGGGVIIHFIIFIVFIFVHFFLYGRSSAIVSWSSPHVLFWIISPPSLGHLLLGTIFTFLTKKIISVSPGACKSSNILGNFCYEVFNTTRTADAALQDCRSKAWTHGYSQSSAQLASILDKTTNDFVNDMVVAARLAARDQYVYDYVYLGGTEASGTPVWKWTSGKQILI